MLRRSEITGLICVWASVFVIPLGTYLQSQSPQFVEYERYYYAGIMQAHPGDALGANVCVLAFAWPFVGCFCVYLGLLFTGGIIFIRVLAGERRGVRLIAAMAFGLGCFVGSVLAVREA